jgi:metallo-beta-lactamase family protein
MKIEFVGAARCVTGSSYILKVGDRTIMIDCGMFQGNRILRDRNHLHLIYAPEKIDALLLTHAHIDHSGLIPKLIREGFTKSIYATKATVDLCSVMLPDSAHIQELDTQWLNKRNKKVGLDPVEPIYSIKDAEDSIEHFVPVNYGADVEIFPGIIARFRDAGHILGSAFIELLVEEGKTIRKIVFSGDIGSSDQAIIKDPETADEADILLIESTYGDRLHKNKQDTYEEFRDIILNSYNKKGNIVIPSFAVERTQEIIFTLGRLFKNGSIPKIPVYIDSPLAISATEIFRKNADCFDDEMNKLLLSGDNPLDFDNLHFTRSTEDSKLLNEQAKGAIIISASGMCTAGRIKYHLMHNLYKPESSVIFVGYQAEGTLGRRLVEGEKKVRIYSEDVAVRAKIHTLGGFSAHADKDALIAWMGRIKNDKLKVFVVHGEESVSLSFAKTIEEKFGYGTYVPKWGEIVDLETMETTVAEYGKAAEPAGLDRDMEDLKSTMARLVSRYNEAKEKNSIYDYERLGQNINDLREMIKNFTDEI